MKLWQAVLVSVLTSIGVSMAYDYVKEMPKK